MARLRRKKTSFGRYQLVTRLAVGGMSEIFLACERGVAGFERLVVIKRILPHLAAQESFVDMFLREARIIARLNHPNVVQIYELGQSGGYYYIAMEYLHGSTVRELQYLAGRSSTKIPHDVAVGLVTQAARGLHAAHELTDLDGRPLGLVHRDVSPHNMMVGPDGHIKLLDFGIAKATESWDTTYSEGLKGKFPYMSPEQCRHEPLDRRSDIFSLGVVLWELLANQKLYRRDSEMAIMKAITEETPPLPSSLAPSVPGPLEEIAMKALAKAPEDRFGDADEMRRALLTAAADRNLDIGKDLVARFIRTLAGDTLAERRTTLKTALEQTIRSADRRRLVHQSSATPIPSRESPGMGIRGRSELETDSERRLVDGGSLLDQAKDWYQRQRRRPDLEKQSLWGRLWAFRWLTSWRFWIPIGLTVAILAPLMAHLGRRSDSSGELGGAPASLEDRSHNETVQGIPLPLCWPPYVDPAVLESELSRFRTYLESELHRPVPLTISETYADCSQMVTTGEVAFGILPPLLYVRTKRQHPDIELLAFKQYEGTNSYDGWLMVRVESPFRRLEDLQGHRFCFTNPDSSSGYFLPRLYIREQGYDPDQFIGDIQWSGDHLQALRDILQERCDVVATYNGALFSADPMGLPVGRLRFLAVTGTVPQDAVVASPFTPSGDRARIQQALFAFDPQSDLGVTRLGNLERITGFSPPDDEAFDDLRRALGIEDHSP